MTHTQRNLSVEMYRPPQDLISGVAGGRLDGRNSVEISGLTNRRRWAGCEQAVRTEKESIWSLVNAYYLRKATVYFTREANNSAYEIRMSRISSGVHGSECLDRGVEQHGRSSPAYPPNLWWMDKTGPIRLSRKGLTSWKEVGQGHSSVDRRDSITRQERRALTLAVLNLKVGEEDCR